MRALSESTVAQFVFVQTPDIAFADLVDELGQALDNSGAGERQTFWLSEALVLMDIVGLRFAIALDKHPADTDAGCLTLSVGPAGAAAATATAPFDPAEMCQLLARRLEAVLLPDMTFWHRVEGPVGPDTIDRLIASLPEVGAMRSIGAFRARPRHAITATPTAEGDKAVIDALLAELSAGPAAQAAPAPADPADWSAAQAWAEDSAEALPLPLPAEDAPRLPSAIDMPASDDMARPEAAAPADPTTGSPEPAVDSATAVILPLERTARPSADARPQPRRATVRPARPAAAAPATATVTATATKAPAPAPRMANRAQAPDPAPGTFGSVEEMARIRSALYPPEAANAETDAPEARLRLAAHTMDATLLVVAPPVGAAIMAYGVLRGGDLIRSGRAMALTCTAVALMHTQGLGFISFV